jgi:hypothetical protein
LLKWKKITCSGLTIAVLVLNEYLRILKHEFMKQRFGFIMEFFGQREPFEGVDRHNECEALTALRSSYTYDVKIL